MTREKTIVHQTTNYKTFKLISGNRKDAKIRAKKIAKSVEKVGYLPIPIVVNEHMEIIDGQARFAFCEESNTPITYIVIPGLGLDECVAINASTSNWKIIDYISSYADSGIESYILLRDFLEKSPYALSLSFWAMTMTDITNKMENIKDGSLELTLEMYDHGEDIIEYWKRFDDIPTNRKTALYEAIGYCYLMDCVDNERLCRKIHGNPRAFSTVANITDAIDVIEDVYNTRAREYVFIETEFFRYLDTISPGLSRAILKKRSRRV